MATTVEDMTHAADARPGDAPRDPSADAAQPDPPQASGAGWRHSVTPNTIVAGSTVMFAAVIALAAALLVAQLSAINDGIGRLDTKIDNVETNLNTKIDNVEANLNTKIDNVEANLNTKIDNVEANLNTRIDNLDAKIDKVETSLRAEMQAGFAQINTVLLDHTDRLARLETHAGLAAAAPHS